MARREFLKSSASASAILHAIRQDTREWRESAIPAKLRDDGVFQVEGSIRGSRFRMQYAAATQDRPNVLLDGAVATLPDGSTRVTATIRRRSAVFALPVLLGVLGLWEWYRSGTATVLIAAVVAFVIAAVYNEILPARDVRGAEYLLARLRRTVDRASGIETSAPAS